MFSAVSESLKELWQLWLSVAICEECSTGWYATDIKEVVAKMAPGARMAVLPKLFWLSPVVASGDPPQIWGEELPGQQEPVLTDWPQKIQEDVEEHFARVLEQNAWHSLAIAT